MPDSINHVKPQTSTEAKLVQIWKELLETDHLGIDDNFIDLGGNSLSAIRCIVGVKKSFGIELLLEEFFSDSSTVKALAAIIDNALSDSTSSRHAR